MKKESFYVSLFVLSKEVKKPTLVSVSISDEQRSKMLIGAKHNVVKGQVQKQLNFQQITEEQAINESCKNYPIEISEIIKSEYYSESNKVRGIPQSIAMFRIQITKDNPSAPKIFMDKPTLGLRNR